MTLRSKVDKIEKIIEGQKDRTLDPHDCFPDWTIEELANYAINGIKPEGKPVGYISKKSLSEFDDWTDEELEHFAKTGEKPKESRL